MDLLTVVLFVIVLALTAVIAGLLVMLAGEKGKAANPHLAAYQQDSGEHDNTWTQTECKEHRFPKDPSRRKRVAGQMHLLFHCVVCSTPVWFSKPDKTVD